GAVDFAGSAPRTVFSRKSVRSADPTRTMRQTASTHIVTKWGVWGAMGLLWLAGGCAAPDFTVSPRYQPSQALTAPAGKPMAVRVEVIDTRTTKPQSRPDGREVLAEG